MKEYESDHKMRSLALAAIAANAAYTEQQAGFRTISGEVNLSFACWRLIQDERTDTQLKIFCNGEYAIIAIRGTQQAIDWRTNAMLRKRQHNGTRIHRGYSIASNSILPEILFELQNMVENKIIITGHSLGGAVATALAISVQDYLASNAVMDKRIVLLATFGQPKIASKRALRRALVGIPYIRVQNGSDIVPRLPRIPFYYGHAGTLLYVKNGNLQHVIDPRWSQRFNDRFLALFDRVADHSMDDYERSVRRYL